MEPKVGSLKKEKAKVGILKKYSDLEKLLFQYKWIKNPKKDDSFEHIHLTNVVAWIEEKKVLHFQVNEKPYFFTSDMDTVRQVLSFIDSAWKKERNSVGGSRLDLGFSNQEPRVFESVA
ncbi:hypothetical protein [Leptospira kmetyi]|uniref:Uncharacterized protein n=1 Tax=Leptospira kmetyi TaxID=408139 RepID=A0ABX4N9E7_9LEPT|nr:hypothetical protein [Leptospira kmetyi]PJZ28722.1 hypothetical protein CH378_16095 [Leptospira kmetyi]PJZ39506.1 hypothetical protein CH370_20840 [Leptospira kmetyi]